MPRDDDLTLGAHGARAARLARTVGHGKSGGHPTALRAAIQRASKIPLDFDHDHHLVYYPEGPDMAYEYQEYPKWVHPDGKLSPKSLIVESREEEETALGGDPVVREADERKRLIKVAEVKGVTIDKRWSLDNLRAAIVGAGFNPELDPFH